MITKVFRICDAYESGIGTGLDGCNLRNPYIEGTDEYEAWDIGYTEGNRRIKKFGAIPEIMKQLTVAKKLECEEEDKKIHEE